MNLTVRYAERWLRDQGFSKAAARHALHHGWNEGLPMRKQLHRLWHLASDYAAMR